MTTSILLASLLASLVSAPAGASTCAVTADNPAMAANNRPAAELTCDAAAGEVVVGLFTEDHAGTWSYWLDGVGVICAPADGGAESWQYLAPDLDLSPGAVNEVRCDDPTGIAYNNHTAIGREHVDAAALVCGGAVTDFPAQDSPGEEPIVVGCDSDQVMIGVAYKDYNDVYGLGFSDAVDAIAPICVAASDLPAAVPLADYDDNGRAPVSLTCADGEILVGAFYDDHGDPGADWADGVGIECAPADDPSDTSIDFEPLDIDGDEDRYLSCDGQEVTGIAYGEVSDAGGRSRVDGFTLLCGEGGDILDNPDLEGTALDDVLCPSGELAVGLAYKDEQTKDNTWSDGVDALTVICAPATCE
jgi:hypothetical protein